MRLAWQAGAVAGMIAILRDATKSFEERKRLRRELAELQAAGAAK
jgi:AmiR/NasT family two-component response regulator